MKFIEFCKKYYNATNSDFPYRRRTNEHDNALTEVMFGRGNIITQRTMY